MTRILVLLGCCWLGALTLLRAETAAVAPVQPGSAADVENEIRALVDAPTVTVVHFWAPWCGNCKTELRPDGWAKFVNENPEVKVVFVNIWHGGQDGASKLAAAGLGGVVPANFLAITHPNGSRKPGEKLESLLGLPVAWVPTTWVFRAGKQRYALNYGEVRFEMLQQMVRDAAAKW